MSSKKNERASLPVHTTSLKYHLKPRPLEAGADLTENRKDRRSQKRASRGFRVGGTRGTATRGAAPEAGKGLAVETKPEPVSGWITRAQARSLLGIEESELAALIARFRLRQSWVEVYSKPEILALREIVAKLR